MRTQTEEFILNTRKSATSVAEEMVIDINTVCHWARDYRRKNKMGIYAKKRDILRRNQRVP